MHPSQILLRLPVPTAAALFLFSAGALLAQQPPADDAPQQPAPAAETPRTTIEEEIVVSAHRIELPARRIGSSVTVIDRDEIERRHEVSALELLRTVSGLEVVQSGGPGTPASVFIRGGDSAHTLVLVDGVRVNANPTGAFDFSDLTADNLERIEILRGPQGTLYGSEAVAGVVSITTRRGEGPPRVWGGGELGNEDSYRLRAGVDGGGEKLHYSFTASSARTEGLSAASEAAGNTEEDPWENVTASGRLGTRFAGDGRIDLAFRWSEGEVGLDGFTFGVGPTDSLTARQEQESALASLTVSKRLAPAWRQTFFVGANRHRILGQDPEDPFGNFDINGRTVELLSQSDLTLSPADTLSFGVRLEERRGENVGSYDDSVSLRSAFVQNLWTWRDRHELTVSARHDDHSELGGETTFRVTSSLLFSPRIRGHGSYGTGFKAPSFNDLYFPEFGNPDLAPETSEGFDVGVEGTLVRDRLTADLTYFELDFEDLIDFTFPDGFVNVAAATSRGFELSLRWRPSDDLLVRASHTHTETEDLATGLQLPRRPEDRSVLSVAFDPGERLTGSLSVIAVRDRIDFDGAVMDDYERVDLTLAYRTGRRLRPYVRVRNLLDEDYTEVPGFTTPGALVAVGLEIGGLELGR